MFPVFYLHDFSTVCFGEAHYFEVNSHAIFPQVNQLNVASYDLAIHLCVFLSFVYDHGLIN